MSVETGFDEGRPIKAVHRPDGSLVIIDGHWRKRAALRLGLPRVPVTIAALPDPRPSVRRCSPPISCATASIARSDSVRPCVSSRPYTRMTRD
jgi:hypothetical protein